MGMSQGERRRNRLGMVVSWLAAADPDFAQLFPIRDSEGRRVIVPFLMDDPMPFAIQVVHRFNDAGNVVTIDRDEEGGPCFRIATMRTEVCGPDHWDCHLPVTRATTVGDMFRMIPPGAAITIRVANEELELDDMGHRPVPHGQVNELLDA